MKEAMTVAREPAASPSTSSAGVLVRLGLPRSATGHTHRGTKRCAVVAFPPAGAGATFYAPVFAGRLPEMDVYGVQYPGRQSRLSESAVSCRETLVAEAVEALRGLAAADVLDVLLVGHSVGAQIAFETALALQDDERVRVRGVVLSARGCFDNETAVPAPDFVHASDLELLHWLHSIGGVPDVVLHQPDLVAMVARQLRADLAVSACPDAPGCLDVPLVLLCGAEDSVCSLERMASWGSRTTASMTTISLPGDHDAIRTAAAQWIEQTDLFRSLV